MNAETGLPISVFSPKKSIPVRTATIQNSASNGTDRSETVRKNLFFNISLENRIKNEKRKAVATMRNLLPDGTRLKIFDAPYNNRE